MFSQIFRSLLLPRRDLPGGAVVEDPPNNAGDASNVGSIPGLEISSGVGNSIPFQYSCLENSVDRGTWQPDMTERTYAHTHTHTHTHTHCLGEKEFPVLDSLSLFQFFQLLTQYFYSPEFNFTFPRRGWKQWASLLYFKGSASLIRHT